MASRFLQIHTLTSYPAALLNRDDAGFAKRLPFGGRDRTRISSQCLKRHWRRDDGPHALSSLQHEGADVPMAYRSRRTFERYIYKPLLDDGVPEPMAREVVECLMAKVLGESAATTKAKAKAKADKEAEEGEEKTGPRTKQVTVLGHPEVTFLLAEAKEICDQVDDAKAVKKAVDGRFKKEAGKNLGALSRGLALGLDAALFGRMITGDLLSRADAALHVAHAFTVHAADVEPDYFSAVDDLAQDDRELGSGHINTSELTSGLYYGYVVVDVPLLISNLTGCPQEQWQEQERDLAAEVVRRLVQLVATVSPGAKLGSTAPYAAAHLLMIEAGHAAPRTLANAFLEPVVNNGKLLRETYGALAAHLAELDQAYDAPDDGRRTLALGPKDALGDGVGLLPSLREVATWAAERVAS